MLLIFSRHFSIYVKVKPANDLKKVIDEIKEIEVKRISELKNAAKSKLEDFKKEINFLTILKIRSKLIIINQIRRDQVLKFMT